MTQTEMEIDAYLAGMKSLCGPSSKEATTPGDIVQIDPSLPDWGACLVTVTEVAVWGIQGYTQIPNSSGQAYIRCKHEDVYRVGRAEWLAGEQP